MDFIKNLFIRMPGLVFGIFTMLLNAAAWHFPQIIEGQYSRGIYQGVRAGFDNTLGQLPIPAFYLFWLLILWLLVRMFWQRPIQAGWRKFSLYGVRRLLNFSGWLFGLFFWLWGFNYARMPLETQLHFQPEPLDTLTLWRGLREETRVLDSLRQKLVGRDTNALEDERFWPPFAEDTVRKALTDWLNREGFPTGGRVRAFFIYPEGTLFKFGASGIYWPFIGQGNLEGGMHPLRKLPAMAHEMSHGYGFTDEGVCNFLAYVSCAEHPNPYLAYSARLDFWATLASACYASDPQRYEAEFKPFIPRGIVSDQHAIRRRHQRFKELAPAMRYQVYDAYLKAQGVAAGMQSYDEVLMLVFAWRGRK